jgi:hypothetical protein
MRARRVAPGLAHLRAASQPLALDASVRAALQSRVAAQKCVMQQRLDSPSHAFCARRLDASMFDEALRFVFAWLAAPQRRRAPHSRLTALMSRRLEHVYPTFVRQIRGQRQSSRGLVVKVRAADATQASTTPARSPSPSPRPASPDSKSPQARVTVATMAATQQMPVSPPALLAVPSTLSTSMATASSASGGDTTDAAAVMTLSGALTPRDLQLSIDTQGSATSGPASARSIRDRRANLDD